MKFYFRFVLLTSLVLPIIPIRSFAQAQLTAPPQFVVLAFDGSKNNDMWKETREFAKTNQVKFTYFINSVYFLENFRAKEYKPPHGLAPGASAIGFGGGAPDITLRIANVNAAKKENNEIACHASGHFDGSNWSSADWAQEFKEFFRLLFDLKGGWEIKRETFIGFRAPQLGIGPGLWPALAKINFRYDTSKSAAPELWPRKNSQGYWDFPLGEIRIAGTGKRTLSMDYNFYVAQSRLNHGEPIPEPGRAAEFSQQMYDSYMNYFNKNYRGNRAPINVGHHFSKWNGGAYWDAMQRFAKSVCHQPDVRCVTYQELADYMDQQKPEHLANFQAGQFAKPAQILSSELSVPAMNAYDFNAELQVSLINGKVQTRLTGADAKMLEEMGTQIHSRYEDQTGSGRPTHLHVVAVLQGKEILSSTHALQKTLRGRTVLAAQSDESRALKGDLPEAHAGEDE